MFSCFLLIVPSIFLFGQQRIEVIGKDTLGCVPINQLKQANVKFVELDACKEENEGLKDQVRSYTGLVANKNSTISDLREAITIDAKLLSDKQKIMDLSDKQLKKANRKVKFLKLGVKVLPPVALVLGAYLGYKVSH